MKNAIFFIILCLVSCRVATAEPSLAPVLAVRPGEEADADKLGYGWSHPERLGDGTTFRWIEKREGDLFVNLEVPDSFHFAAEVMPMVAHERIQHLGLYVNNRFVKEWELESAGHFQWIETEVPESFFLAGTNVLTLRAGYKESPDKDPRTLSVAIKRVVLTRHE